MGTLGIGETQCCPRGPLPGEVEKMTGWPFQAPELSPFPPPPSTSPNPRGTGALVRHRRVISDKPAASTPCLLTSSASSPEGSPQPHPGVCPVLPEEATSHTQHNQGGSVVVRTSALWGQPQGKTLSGLPCLFISLAASGNHLSSQEMTRGDQLLVQSGGPGGTLC